MDAQTPNVVITPSYQPQNALRTFIPNFEHSFVSKGTIRVWTSTVDIVRRYLGGTLRSKCRKYGRHAALLARGGGCGLPSPKDSRNWDLRSPMSKSLNSRRISTISTFRRQQSTKKNSAMMSWHISMPLVMSPLLQGGLSILVQQASLSTATPRCCSCVMLNATRC